MPEQPSVSPLLDGFTLGAPAHGHAGVCCCPAVRADSQRKYIVKIISIPASQAQLDALLITGAYKDSAEAAEYFRSLAEGIIRECKMLEQLSRRGGFVPYEGYQMEPMQKSRTGYEVYLLSGFRLSLERYIHRHAVTHLEAVNLGIDLCTALAACREVGMLYVALKPSNIFISSKKEYKIGDLGFVPLKALKYTPMPEKYRSDYTAPELMDDLSVLNETADTYSAGLILYRIFNDGMLPQDLTKPLPVPSAADEEMAGILLKACDPNPAKRWKSPAEMRQALIDYMQRGTINDVPIMNPIGSEPAGKPKDENTAPVPGAIADDETATPQLPAEPEDASPETLIPEEANAPSPGETAAENVEVPEDAPPEETSQEDPAESEKPEAPEPEAPADETEKIPEEPVSATEECSFEAHEEAAEQYVLDIQEIASPPAPDETPLEEFTPEDAPPEPPPETPAEPLELSDVLDDMEQAAQEAFGEFPSEPPPAEEAESDTIDGEDLDYELAELSKLLRESERPITHERKATPNVAPVVIKQPKKRKSPLRALFVVFLLCLLLAGSVWGYMYYIGEYLQSVSGITVQEEQGKLVVQVTSSAREELLRVVCTDPYGNSYTSPVENGKAEFSQITPGTFYTVQVQVNGFHRLTSNISEVYTTAGTTNIAALNAGSGTQDGSVALSMIVDGAEPAKWQVYYSADGEPELTKTFTGHTVTVENLSIGKLYTFRMEILDGINHYPANGQNTVQFVPVQLIAATDLEVTSFADGKLTLHWNNTSATAPEYWLVNCRGDGFEQTLQAADTTATFEGISEAKAYTVDVCAMGMTQTTRLEISANPITITGFQVDDSDPQELRVSWQFRGTAPENGWQVIYTLDSSNLPSAVKVYDTNAVIAPRIPGAVYHITIQAANDISVFGGTQVYSCPAAADYDNGGVSKANINVKLLVTPDDENWVENPVSSDSVTQLFTLGQPISVVLQNNYGVYLNDDEINILYVYRDSAGNAAPELIGEQTLSWREIWGRNSAYTARLNVPISPVVEGNYTLDIYFNGKLIASASLKVY